MAAHQRVIGIERFALGAVSVPSAGRRIRSAPKDLCGCREPASSCPDRHGAIRTARNPKPRLHDAAAQPFHWNSPFGPVIVDLGFAVVKEDFDETEVLSFSFGTQF